MTEPSVWVVTRGVDSEGADVVGVCSTPEAGKALAEDGPTAFDWSEMAASEPGQVKVWFARAGGDRWAEVTQWEVSR